MLRPAHLLSLLLIASPCLARDLVVARDGVSLRSECSDAGALLASLPEGHVVTLRFAIAGADTRCYSVRAEVDGSTYAGYVEREDLAGIDEIEQRRKEASAARLAHTAVEAVTIAPTAPTGGDDIGVLAASDPGNAAIQAAADAFEAGRSLDVPKLLESVPADNLVAAVLRGSSMLRLTRPAEAQAALDPALRIHPDDPALLGLAGIAAFQQDRAEDAERLLARSVKLRPNGPLENLLERIRTERASDQSDEKTFGSRFVLRYDADALPDASARSLADELEKELPAVSSRLGCQIRDRLTVVVQTIDSYRAGTSTPGWSGGHYDGRIHVALGPNHAIDARVRETITHELVHACLARRGEWPAWLQEGVAQFISGRRLAPQERQALAELNAQGALPTMRRLSGSWARLDPATALTAYTTALAAAQVMFQDMQDYGVRNLLANPANLPDVEKKLDERLRTTLR